MSSKSPAAALSAAQVLQLRQLAAAAAQNAYAPYSHYRVGAALLLASGEIVTGCNVENVSFRLTCCAEQTALGRAVAEHGPAVRLAAVAVANADNRLACRPCGACRQTLAEFAAPNCPVFYPETSGDPAECTLGDLLPAAFGFTHTASA